MELRRHKDILAIRADGQVTAFHARNLELAELSPEAFDALAPVHLGETLPPASAPSGDVGAELEAWTSHDSDTVTSDREAFGIRSLTINVAQICNLHCSYCAAGGDGTYGDPVRNISVEKTLPHLPFFLDQIPKGESFHVAFLGGEPLLYPLAMQALAQFLFEEAEKRGIQVSFKVTTNGTLIDERALNVLRGMNAHVTVSLDGPQEVNDRQRNTRDGQGAFKAAFEGLMCLLEHRRDLASLGVHAVFNEKNLDLEKAWDLFSKLPLDYVEFTYSVNEPKPEVSDAYNAAMSRVLAKAWQKGGERELRKLLNVREVFDRLDEQRRRPNHCGMGKSFLVMDSRNKLWTCPWKVGQTEDFLGEGSDLDYDRLGKYQKSQIEMNSCQSCWARFLCGGGCSFIHGSTNGLNLEKKIDFCERTRFFMAQALMYYGKSRAITTGGPQ